MTRSILCLAAALGTLALAPLTAQASVDGCAQSLLQSPADALYATLQLTDVQVAQINAIRTDLNRRSATAQSDVQLDRELALGISRTAAIMTQWQREQCSDDVEPVVVAPDPIIIEPSPIIYRARVGYRAPVYRNPAPVYRPMYRAPEHRRAPMYRAPEQRRAPMYRAPEHRPAPMYRAPEQRRAPMYRAPAPVRVHAPSVDRTPYRGPASSGGHNGQGGNGGQGGRGGHRR